MLLKGRSLCIILYKIITIRKKSGFKIILFTRVACYEFIYLLFLQFCSFHNFQAIMTKSQNVKKRSSDQ